MNLLRKYIKETLVSEARKGLSDMSEMQVFYIASPSTIEVWLADPKELTHWKNNASKNLGYDSIMNRASIGIISADKISAEPCSGAFTVSWAHVDKGYKGWGPLLYDVAMELATMHGGGLTADRANVSDDAFNIWDYYHKKRGDVAVKQLDDEAGRYTPEDGADDCLMSAAYGGGDGRYGWWDEYDEDNIPWDPDGEEVLVGSPISKIYISKGTPTLDMLKSSDKLINLAEIF